MKNSNFLITMSITLMIFGEFFTDGIEYILVGIAAVILAVGGIICESIEEANEK
jgi:uncharacterized membrane protein YuzA (DUF378 family)